MKVVSVPNGDYKISVRQGSRNLSHQEYGGNITLDVGAADRANRGTVYITGDLIVEGKQTTVESETMTVKDNIIVINAGENSTSPNPGVTLNTAGLTVDRGWKTDASMLFNESVDHYDATGTSTAGTFTFVNDLGDLIGIQTCSINTEGQNLYLINAPGNGIVTVTGTADYERNLFDYETAWEQNPPTGPISIIDPDGLPNVQALADYVDTTLAFFDDYSISESNTSVECIDKDAANPYRLLLNPTYTLPLASKVSFKVDGSERGKFTVGGLDVDYVNVFTNTIDNTTNNLILTATTSHTVEVNAVFQLDDTGLSPTAVAGATKLYTVNSNTTPAPGKTGIYFTNQGNSDELVAKNRALLFSILF
jgi:hypothetical protein